MGSQIPISNNRSRTYWTPIMERFFIDLMLEHKHKGDRSGHTFIKEAWTDMLAVFNAKFASQYDKDALKSRYSSLWKQFNDVKNLLGQNGFAWDGTRQIVVADDCVWDSYLKAHPDARPYKTKGLPSFSDLCLIYGFATADGRYSRSSHDMDIDVDIPGVNSGDPSCSLVSPSSERVRTNWTLSMDKYLVELMLNEQESGKKLDSAFSKQSWVDMSNLFNSRFGPNHSKKVLRHRYKKLLKYYTDVTFLLKQNGFSWDESKQMVGAGDDVWDAYLKARPHARPYRTMVLPYYKNLGLIFGDPIDSGDQRDSCLYKGLEDDIRVPKAGGKRSRTYWTPAMDAYLIDLLLEQVHKGNKLGETFISLAWSDMVTSFNVKFKSHHDRDVLKNRYNQLKRQYNDAKTLLHQNGFSWDEKRQMITAADHVWNAYTKAHPDARSCRVKILPSYHKLCVIYGHDCSSERYSRLAENPELPSEVPLPTRGEDMDDHSLADSNPVMEWTPLMDRYFIDLMLEQVHAQNKICNKFDDHTWAYVTAAFNDTFCLQCDKYALQNRYTFLMKEYSDISCLLNQKGFSWDETQQTVVADDDTWNAYAKEHPESISYKSKSLVYYNDLCTIFGNGIEDRELSSQGLEMEMDFKAVDLETDEVSKDIHFLFTDFEAFHQGKKRPPLVPSVPERSVKTRKIKEEQKESLSKNVEMVTRSANKKQGKNDLSIQNSIVAHQAIPDIDDKLLLDRYDLLEDERKAKTFLALDLNLQKKWLLRKLAS